MAINTEANKLENVQKLAEIETFNSKLSVSKTEKSPERLKETVEW